MLLWLLHVLRWFQGTVSFNLFFPLKRRKMLAYFCANPSFLLCWLGVKITGYPCNIKTQQKDNFRKKNQLVLASRLEDSLLIEVIEYRSWMKRPRQDLWLWLPKSNSRAPRNLLFFVPSSERGSMYRDLLFDHSWDTTCSRSLAATSQLTWTWAEREVPFLPSSTRPSSKDTSKLELESQNSGDWIQIPWMQP